MPCTPSAHGSPTRDFSAVVERLIAILEPYADAYRCERDAAGGYRIETRGACYRGRPMYIAGVRSGKAYASFHLMAVYACPALLRGVSPALKKRMQGKSCFNFTKVDEEMFAELAALTREGFRRWEENRWGLK